MSIRAKVPAKNPAKIAIKGLGRQFEKMKLGFGMVEQTKDSNLNLLVDKYYQHQHGASKFLTSLRFYLDCQKNLQNAYQQIQSSFVEFYDSEWINKDEIIEKFSHFSLIHEEFTTQISDRVIDPYMQYLSRFPIYKDKLDKRGRKLLDYDSCKREVESMHIKITKNKEGKDQKMITRLASLENDFQNCKDQYDKITDELYEDLTLLHNNRVVFSAKILENFFQAEETLHSESTKLFASSLEKSSELHTKGDEHVYDIEVTRDLASEKFEKLSVISDESNFEPPHRQRSGTLEKASLFLTNPIRRKSARISHSLGIDSNNDLELSNGRLVVMSNYSPEQSLESTFNFKATEDTEYDSSIEQRNFLDENMVIVPTAEGPRTEIQPKFSLDSRMHSRKFKPKKPSRPQTFYQPEYDTDFIKKISDDYLHTQNMISTSFYEEDQALIELNRLKRRRTLSVQENFPNVLYRVKALFDFHSDNEDELNFANGDVISVILDSNIDIDDGWLMGKIDSDPVKRGIFPANHTTLL